MLSGAFAIKIIVFLRFSYAYSRVLSCHFNLTELSGKFVDVAVVIIPHDAFYTTFGE